MIHLQIKRQKYTPKGNLVVNGGQKVIQQSQDQRLTEITIGKIGKLTPQKSS